MLQREVASDDAALRACFGFAEALAEQSAPFTPVSELPDANGLIIEPCRFSSVTPIQKTANGGLLYWSE